MSLFSTSVQLLACADDIDVIGRAKQDTTAVVSAIECETVDLLRRIWQ